MSNNVTLSHIYTHNRNSCYRHIKLYLGHTVAGCYTRCTNTQMQASHLM